MPTNASQLVQYSYFNYGAWFGLGIKNSKQVGDGVLSKLYNNGNISS